VVAAAARAAGLSDREPPRHPFARPRM